MPERGLVNPENVSYTSTLDKRVRLYSTVQKAQLFVLHNTLDEINEQAKTDPFGASMFCLDLNEDPIIRDQVMPDVNHRTLTFNGKPATVIQIRDILEESGYPIDISNAQAISDDDLSRRAHENYARTAVAWTEEAADNLGNSSLRFMHDIREVEKLADESGLDLTAGDGGVREMKRGYFKKLRNDARSVTNSITDEITAEKVMLILEDITNKALAEDPEVSEEYVKRVYPKIVEFISKKLGDLRNRKDNLGDRLMAGITYLAEFSHRDVSQLIKKQEELDQEQQAAQIVKETKPTILSKLSKYVVLDLRPDWGGERGD